MLMSADMSQVRITLFPLFNIHHHFTFPDIPFIINERMSEWMNILIN